MDRYGGVIRASLSTSQFCRGLILTNITNLLLGSKMESVRHLTLPWPQAYGLGRVGDMFNQYRYIKRL